MPEWSFGGQLGLAWWQAFASAATLGLFVGWMFYFSLKPPMTKRHVWAMTYTLIAGVYGWLFVGLNFTVLSQAYGIAFILGAMVLAFASLAQIRDLERRIVSTTGLPRAVSQERR
jgi:hypothetical protein